ncbi:hypothetical protein AWB82_00491 [Caballeronia glebae]|uniref:Uncharacterized protein n=1 Tax=Caballeronia glebae TaxID=1777143 RepID=A0A157ZBU5_9BURK|nr:metallophosphoesterase [Caballeronia glebae]SAK42953.1 hypothetical protein AWB82_00491 [Caballeronia glebae]
MPGFLKQYFFLAFALVFASTGSAPAWSAPDCSTMNTPILQSVNPALQSNLLTPWQEEIDSAARDNGFTDKRGTAFLVSMNQADGLVPVTRTYHPGTHDFFWTTNPQSAAAYGYQPTTLVFYASPDNASGCDVPVYRFNKNGMHRYAVTPADQAQLKADNWTADGVVFWARANPKFSIAIMPDTQMEVGVDGGGKDDKRFAQRTQWLADSRYTLNLQYVLHSGDVTNWGERDTPQLDMASEAIKRLEQVKLPYVLTVGNHDTRAVCAGGSACPGEKAWETVRQLPAFNRYFNARFSNGGVAGQFAAGDLSNVYSTFEAGGLKWLVMSLELWPRAEVLTWADGIIKSMPTRNVIIVTHSFLNSGGAIRADNGGYGVSSPATIYEKVIKYNPNVRFVFSGHEGNAARLVVPAGGNNAVAYLQAFHSATTNPVRIVEIDTDANTATSFIAAPYTNETWDQYWSLDSNMKYVR